MANVSILATEFERQGETAKRNSSHERTWTSEFCDDVALYKLSKGRSYFTRYMKKSRQRRPGGTDGQSSSNIVCFPEAYLVEARIQLQKQGERSQNVMKLEIR